MLLLIFNLRKSLQRYLSWNSEQFVVEYECCCNAVATGVYEEMLDKQNCNLGSAKLS